MERVIKRRTLAAGAAWSVPAIALVSAAPSMAASTPPPTLTLLGQCKSPGNSCAIFPKGYLFTFTVCNNGPEPIYIYTVTYTTAGTNLTLTNVSPVPTFEILPGCRTMTFQAHASASANQNFTFTLTLAWGHTLVAGADPNPHPNFTGTYSVPSTPPRCVIPGCK